MKKGLTLTDLLVTIVISIVFGIVYKLWGPLYYAVKPLGLHLDQLIYGMWFIAASVAYLLVRKPGVALLAEVAASSGEFLMGSEWGLEVLLYGLLQGLFAEAVYACFRYRRFHMSVVSLASIASTAASLIMDFYKGYIEDLAFWNVSLLIVFRLLGSILIAGAFAHYLVKALEATGVADFLRPVSQKDYESLD